MNQQEIIEAQKKHQELQQKAQSLYSERMKAFRENTIFDSPLLLGMHHLYLKALEYTNILDLKINLDDYLRSIKEPETISVNSAGLVLMVLERAKPVDLGLSIVEYAGLQTDIANITEQWKAIVAPQADLINKEIQDELAAAAPKLNVEQKKMKGKKVSLV